MAQIAAQTAMAVLSMASANKQASQTEKVQSAQYADARNRALRVYEINEKKRKDELKRALASSRARFGASGTGMGGGSNRALLNGLIAIKDENTANAQEQLGWNLGDLRKRNLLQTAAISRSSSAKAQQGLMSLGGNVIGGLMKSQSSPNK